MGFFADGTPVGEARKRRRRQRLEGGALPAAPGPDIEFAFRTKADLSTGDLASGGGLLVDEQGPLRRRRRRGMSALDFMFRAARDKQSRDEFLAQQSKEPLTGTGPTSRAPNQAEDLILPAELRSGDRRQPSQDALRALFGPDFAGLPPAVVNFAQRELEAAEKAASLEKGDVLDPDTVRDILRVARSCAILVKSEQENGEFREDPLQIRKFDDELQIVWGEVYIPGLPDSQGDFMEAEEIRKAAFCFMANNRLDQIDRMHDREACGAYVVESVFIDPELFEKTAFIPGSWVVGVHIPDVEIWAAVKRGDFNGFSMEGLATRHEKQFELDLPDEVAGTTQAEDDHSHPFVVRFDEQGQFLGGEALPATTPGQSTPHSHGIQKGSVTEAGGANKHVHRFSFAEAILEVSIGRRRPDPEMPEAA